MPDCFHCGLPAYPEFSHDINGQTQPFCCLGCQAIALAINAEGLSEFYQYRDNLNQKPDTPPSSFLAYDLDDVQSEFVTELDNDLFEANINIGGISCAACAWLIENYLQAEPAIKQVSVNVSSHRCRIVWRRSSMLLSEVFAALTKIGYVPSPAIASESQEFRKREYKSAIMRLGVAGVGMMQVGMVAIALHAGDIQGITDHWQNFLRWVSLLFATPVILYSARPFFVSAYRAIKLKHLNMDVSVSLALLLAFGASCWATFKGHGEVYYDSVSMFTFFLLLGRFLEMRARHSSAFEAESLFNLLPRTVERFNDQERETREMVPLKSIVENDLIWIPAGAVIACDGEVVSGESAVDESLLTGESEGQLKSIGDKVSAGTVNGEIGLVVRVERTGNNTGLAAVERLVNDAMQEKPSFVALVDRIASKFVAIVLLIATIVGGYWFIVDPDQALWIALSVLVVTCPCALSLATPAALTAGTNKMRKLGLLIRAQHVLEGLPSISKIVFDKTGTLTEGKLWVAEVNSHKEGVSRERVLDIVGALEKHSAHPIARAFEDYGQNLVVSEVNSKPGFGIEGSVGDQRYRFGRLEYITCWQESELSELQTIRYPDTGLWLVLATQKEIIAWVLLEDAPRQGIDVLLQSLRQSALSFVVLSGDREENVNAFTAKHHITESIGGVLPDGKLAYIQQLQSQGEKVLMVGDGINDVPVLSASNISIAMGAATQMARANADCVLLNEKLTTLVDAITLAKKVKLTIRQNLCWALGYNALALPAAALGYIPPYLAAVGMSLSSLVVVLNALRLERYNLHNKSTGHL